VSKKEFGRPGHFIGSQKCRFFRHTHVDHICISTVGDYCPTTNKKEPLGMWFGDEKEGLYRYYETMVCIPRMEWVIGLLTIKTIFINQPSF
jgi:hypothetical protein